ncbi:MAG: MCE family protein [Verrucomicrobia bacterium]|nr:MCE family protein [Verrucomicrobiota bacterium]
MKNTLETRLGIFFALALIAGAVLLEMAGGADFFKKGKQVKALFNNVQDLKPGDPVKMAGVAIGKVETIGFSQGRVEVTFKVTDPQAAVKTDSKAVIKFLGLLGQNYLAISIGSAGAIPVENGAVIESTEQPDLSTLMAKLEGVATGVENVTKNFSADNFSNLLGPFTDFLKENKPRLDNILVNMQTISSNVASGQGSVGKMINDEALYSSALGAVNSLKAATHQIQSTVESAKSLVTDVNEGKGTIGKLVRDESLFRETTNAMTQLREILQKINQGHGSVGKLVNDESLFKNAKMTLQKVDKATEGLEDQGPLSVISLVVGSLF